MTAKVGRRKEQLDLERAQAKRYPCSYMIYSEAFDALPAEARDAVYKRLWQILSGTGKGSKYARLSLADREAVSEILGLQRRTCLRTSNQSCNPVDTGFVAPAFTMRPPRSPLRPPP